MMTMSGRITGCCAALFLVLTSVSAVQRLNSINDLKKIKFGQSVPKHSLLLLHWFANTAVISDDVVRLRFNPEGDEYGSHHYGNYEGMLESLPRGYYRYQYYTVGNLRQGATQLPHHVVYPSPEYDGRNMDRIIVRIRIREPNMVQTIAVQTIDQVYITQHYSANQLSEYDPEHTYQVTTNLLREIRHFPMEGNPWLLTNLRDRFGSNINDNHLSHIRNMWDNLACLGLLLSIVFQERFHFTLQSAPSVQQDFWGNFQDCAACVLRCVFFTFLFILMIIVLVIAVNNK